MLYKHLNACVTTVRVVVREQDPRYGFIILNRLGTDDLIQYLSPQDFMQQVNHILVYRSGCLSDDAEADNESTIGLWTQSSNERESMATVMLRVMECVKNNVRYPNEFR